MNMNAIKIQNDLYQFNTYVDSIDMSFNQFLLSGPEPLLVHTGTHEHMKALLPQVRTILGGRELSHVFISHFESDECGGLSLLLEAYPEVEPLCSEITARQLHGFGITDSAVVESEGKVLYSGDRQLEFVSFPSEMHLWEGLMMFERKSKVLYSSDLFGQFGRMGTEAASTDWNKLIAGISSDSIPCSVSLESVQAALAKLPVTLIAPGHGPCVRVSGK
jgi:flavorubredoxin